MSKKKGMPAKSLTDLRNYFELMLLEVPILSTKSLKSYWFAWFAQVFDHLIWG